MFIHRFIIDNPFWLQTMSYDYNALVSSIAQYRNEIADVSDNLRKLRASSSSSMDINDSEYSSLVEQKLTLLQSVTTTFETLSGYCPMTPLLWMQYASCNAELVSTALSMAPGASHNETASVQTRLHTLELGLQEFPGSALLHLHYLHLLSSTAQVGNSVEDLNSASSLEENNRIDEQGEDTIDAAYRNAIQFVGLGSHANENVWVASIYRLYAAFLARQATVAATKGGESDQTTLIGNQIVQLFIQRASSPLGSQNDGLWQEVSDFVSTALPGKLLQASPQPCVDMKKLQTQLDYARRRQATTFGHGKWSSYEVDIDAAMAEEMILGRDVIGATGNGGSTPNVELVLASSNNKTGDLRYGMGLGGQLSAQAFIRYARAYYKQYQVASAASMNTQDRPSDPAVSDESDGENNENSSQNSYLTDQLRLWPSLCLCVYERGVSECPTIESLWMSYARTLQQLVESAGDQDAHESSAALAFLPTCSKAVFSERLRSVVVRAVRNCPHSLALAKYRLQSHLSLAEFGSGVFDPDEVTGAVRTSLDLGFLPDPSSFLELHLAACRTVKRRIMQLLCGASPSAVVYAPGENNKKTTSAIQGPLKYDEAESLHSSSALISLDDSIGEEVADLCEDLTEMYDNIDRDLRKCHESWSEGRALLCRDRALSEALLLHPLRTLESSNSPGRVGTGPLVYFEKTVKLHLPPKPDAYGRYIQVYIDTAVSTTNHEVLVKIRRVRGLFEKALNSVGNSKVSPVAVPSVPVRDFDTALSCLSCDWIEFEHILGTEKSLLAAKKCIQQKLEKLKSREPIQAKSQGLEKSLCVGDDPVKNSMQVDHSEASNKPPPPKKRKTSASDVEQTEVSIGPNTSAKTNAVRETKACVHKVKVGTLEYPAHRFTIRVTRLKDGVADMDLVDAFRTPCGPIVHARIVREKHHHGKGKSKGWGLVQFEEQESVERALALDGILSIQDSCLRVDRSHIPAVSVVPAGMHRVPPKEVVNDPTPDQRQPTSSLVDESANTDAAVLQKPKPARNQNVALLSFRPRAVSSRKKRI
jgi:RNA recognition motif. (a.k.a. RRM, RBD, or RNP domain)